MTIYRSNENLFNILSMFMEMSKSDHFAGEASDPKNLDVSTFLEGLFSKIMLNSRLGALPTTSAFISQQVEVSRQAAIAVGSPDGRISEDLMPLFAKKEGEIGREVTALSQRLRNRSVELAGTDLCSYLDSFEKDSESLKIMNDAIESGISPTLVDSVKSKLLKEEEALWGGATDFMRSSLGR